MKKWRFFTIGSGRERIATVDALIDFLSREASLIAQKSIVDYCHMKTRLPLTELTREKVFAEAFDAARHTSYAAVLADLIATVEAHLRGPAGQRRKALPQALARVYADAIAKFEAGAAGTAHGGEEIARRLAQLQLTAPKSSADIAFGCANTLFDALPIHPSLRKHDREPVAEGVRFLFMSRCQRLTERLEFGTLIDQLLAHQNRPVASPGTAPA